MPEQPDMTRDGHLHVRKVDASEDALILQVIGLADRCRGTLGFLPRSVFFDMAASGALYAIVEQQNLVAYSCVSPTRRFLRLVHLCVDPAHRGRGLAKILFEQIVKNYSYLPGILLRCRNDYGLAAFWSQLGFRQRVEVVGRSREGHPLTVWWYDNGHPDLFTAVDEPLLRAAVDLNIVRDLGSDATREDARESQALVADHVVGRLALVNTPTLSEEVDTLDDPSKKRACFLFLGSTQPVNPSPAEVARIAADLLSSVQQRYPRYPLSESDRFDLRHVAASAAAGIPIFVTRDEHLATILGSVAMEKYNVNILRPAEVVANLDELTEVDAYRPADLAGTGYVLQRLGAGHEGKIKQLVNKAAKESTKSLLSIWREAAIDRHDRLGLFGPDGKLLAAWVSIVDGRVLRVPLLRVASDRLAETIARQIVFGLRQEALRRGAVLIAINDRNVGVELRSALADDGFRDSGNGWQTYVIRLCGTSDHVEAQVHTAASELGLPPPPGLRPGLEAASAALFERAWWPVKITDSQIPCYIVPIRQSFSADLFGVPAGLLVRDEQLGLSREHVYYTGSTARLTAPGRLLWYMSEGGQAVVEGSVIACSQLDDVVTGTPDQLHTRFRHLGVWDLGQLQSRARNGKLQALRFSNTEILRNPVAKVRLRELARVFGKNAIPQSPQRISVQIFAAIYQEAA